MCAHHIATKQVDTRPEFAPLMEDFPNERSHASVLIGVTLARRLSVQGNFHITKKPFQIDGGGKIVSHTKPEKLDEHLSRRVVANHNHRPPSQFDKRADDINPAHGAVADTHDGDIMRLKTVNFQSIRGASRTSYAGIECFGNEVRNDVEEGGVSDGDENAWRAGIACR